MWHKLSKTTAIIIGCVLVSITHNGSIEHKNPSLLFKNSINKQNDTEILYRLEERTRKLSITTENIVQQLKETP